MPLLESTDICVIGGGPAGLAVAIAARLQGFDVVVADAGEPPIDKACGEGLMPDGVAALERLGISVDFENSYAFRGIRFLSDGLSVEAPFPKRAFGKGVRRTVLHQILVDHAASLGIKFLWQTVVTGISGNEVRLGNRRIDARWIIGADGGASRVRQWAKLDPFRKSRRRYAFRQHYQIVPWTDRVELYWGQHGEIYVTPVSQGEVGVALISDDPKLRLADALPHFPDLNDRLGRAAIVTVEKGAPTSTSSLRRVSRGNVALIGDASGTVDAIAGEGLALAFRQAIVLAECLKVGDLARYESEHRRFAMLPRLMARLMLALDGRPRLQQRTLRAFQKRPEIFRRLLELHVGILSPMHLTLDGLTLGWGLLTA